MKAMATNQTVSWFYQHYKEEKLELSAAFQRNPVWRQPQKDYLIETLLLELPMPEVYVINQVTPTGDSKWIVVDGQQRLRTILEFVSPEFPLIVKIEAEGFKHVKSFSNLTSEQKTRFWRYPIVVRDLEDSSDEQVRDLFQRLNKYSENLTDQELRKARFKGEFLDTVTKLGDLEFWLEHRIFPPNYIRRMRDLEYIGVLLSTMIGGIYNRSDRLDEFYVNYEGEFEEREYYFNRFLENIKTIERIIPNLKQTRWKNNADFYTLFLLIDSLRDELSLEGALDTLSNRLQEFITEIELAKEDTERASEIIRQYIDAATYGTNDREKRVRRLRILKEYIQPVIEIERKSTLS